MRRRRIMPVGDIISLSYCFYVNRVNHTEAFSAEILRFAV